MPTLYNQFNDIELSDIYKKEKEKEIIVKDKNKNRVDFKGNKKTKQLRNKIKMANKLYEKFDIRTVLNGERNTTRLFPQLTAIYNNDSFKDGGRLYDMPYRGEIRYQQLSK